LKLKAIDDLHELIDEFRINKKKTVYVFLDEIQVIDDWEKYLKSTYDANSNLKFIISGSTASFFASDVASLLTGRHFYHKIETLLYKEYLRINPNGNLKDYFEWGGFPEVIKAKSLVQKEAILESYLSTIIQRDIIERHDIRSKKKITDLIQSLLLTVGGKINLTKLSNQFEINVKTIERYIELAKDAFLFQEVPFFSYSKRKNKHMLPKLYPADIGFTRYLSKRYEQGRSAEWAIAHYLKEVSYWTNDNHEIDFVTDKYAIQVTLTDNIPEREFESFKDFNKKYSKTNLILSLQSTDRTTSIEQFLLN
jgi:predicted AAA+ superfamily ATPase